MIGGLLGQPWVAQIAAAQAAATAAAAADVAAALALLTTGEEAYSRLLLQGGAVSSPTGRLRVTCFTARKTGSINSVRMITGSTAAAATPTLCRMGLYSIDGTGAGTLVASTANDTALFATANTEYTEALTSPWAKVAGNRYAAASLVVTAFTAPTLVGQSNQSGAATDEARPPEVGFLLDGQADLPATFTLAGLTVSANAAYFEFVP